MGSTLSTVARGYTNQKLRSLLQRSHNLKLSSVSTLLIYTEYFCFRVATFLGLPIELQIFKERVISSKIEDGRR